MTQRAPFIRTIRSNTDTRGGEVRITIRVFWFHLTPEMLRSLNDVTLEYRQTVPTSHYGPVEEFRLTVKGDTARCKTVQSAVLQLIRGNTPAWQALVALANQQQ